jgi:CRISPR-associated exonuclease Cas4
MTTYLIVIFLLLLVASWLLLRRAGAQQKQAGLPQGRIVYTDTGAWNRVEEPLWSRRHLLAGKPDYLVEQNGHLIPVEVKPNRSSSQPYDSDVLQLAAYCLLVEETYGQRPEHGLIRYQNQTFAVDYTPELREMLLDTLDAMRRDAVAQNVGRSHEQAGRCRACGFRADCAQGLA